MFHSASRIYSPSMQKNQYFVYFHLRQDFWIEYAHIFTRCAQKPRQTTQPMNKYTFCSIFGWSTMFGSVSFIHINVLSWWEGVTNGWKYSCSRFVCVCIFRVDFMMRRYISHHSKKKKKKTMERLEREQKGREKEKQRKKWEKFVLFVYTSAIYLYEFITNINTMALENKIKLCMWFLICFSILPFDLVVIFFLLLGVPSYLLLFVGVDAI